MKAYLAALIALRLRRVRDDTGREDAVLSGDATGTASTMPSEAPATSPSSQGASSGISVNSTAPSVSMPAEGLYFCVSKDIAICTDRGGDGTSKALATGGFFDAPSLSIASRTVYFRSNSTPTAGATTIQRVSLDGGQSTTVVTVAPNAGDEGVALGVPQVSPDGHFLAYVVTVGVLQPPSSPGPSHSLVLPSPVGPQIFVLDVSKPSARPLAVPMAMTGADLAEGFVGYALVGWAPDDSRLYYYGGRTHDLKALSMDAAARPVGVETIVPGAPTQHDCPDGTPTGVMTPSGDVLFTAYCNQQPLTIYRVHDGSVSTFASLPQLTGKWLTQEIIVDTTGRRVQLDAAPFSDDCVSGEAFITFLDSSVVGQQIETQHFGCPPGTVAVSPP